MASALPILTFHALDERASVISYSPELFRRFVARLHENGYRTVGLSTTVEVPSSGSPFPERALIITFDDGYRSVYETAFPVLQGFGMSATVFLTVGEGNVRDRDGRLPSFEGRAMLSWREIEEMKTGGMDFGAHTLTHPDLTRLPPARMKAEICNGQAVIEEALQTPVSWFAYPYGRWSGKAREVVQQHFLGACSDRLGLVTTKSDRYGLERIDAYYLRTERLFNLMFSRLFPWYIQARSLLRRARRRFQAR